MRNNNRKGFTLIELLIVIAIIGILAAVLIPNLLGARVRAFETAAQSCAKGFATAAEIRMIDANTYAGTDLAFVQANGGNMCVATGATGPVLTITTVDASTYAASVAHSAGGRTFNVTPAGIVPAP